MDIQIISIPWATYNPYYIPPQNDTEQSTHETDAHCRHFRAWASTWFFLSISAQPSQEKKTIVLRLSRK